MESAGNMLLIAEKCKSECEKRGFTYIFKASFDKANRTSASSFRGLGLETGITALKMVKEKLGVFLTTDIHESYQAAPVGEAVDIVQIPAFLARQTDLLIAAAQTGKVVNIKKAQFMSAKDMRFPVEKVRRAGNDNIIVTERGTAFGYNNLVVDFRGLADMKELGVPRVMDVTHSTQRPSGADGSSGGDRKYAPYLTAAAAAIGTEGYFFEVHPEPDKALSDGPNTIPLDRFGEMLDIITALSGHKLPAIE
jgi:2-dehydro-3-deoxyphosphooctonate aldolase (KDO 8-P synthase)